MEAWGIKLKENSSLGLGKAFSHSHALKRRLTRAGRTWACGGPRCACAGPRRACALRLLSEPLWGGSASPTSGERAPPGNSEGAQVANVWWLEDRKTRAKKSLVSGVQRMENIANNIPQTSGCLAEPQISIFLHFSF